MLGRDTPHNYHCKHGVLVTAQLGHLHNPSVLNTHYLPSVTLKNIKINYFPQLDKLWCTLFRTNRVLARCQVTSGPRLNYFNFPRDGSADTNRYQQPSNGEIPTTNNLRSGRCQTGAIWPEISISYPTTAFYLHWTGDSRAELSPWCNNCWWCCLVPARVGSWLLKQILVYDDFHYGDNEPGRGETWNNEQNFNVVNVWTEAECLPICRW